MTHASRQGAGFCALLFAIALFVYGGALAIALGLDSTAVLFTPWGTPSTAVAAAGAPDARSIALDAADGTQLAGLRLDAAGAAGAAPWVLFFYGNAESAGIEQPRLEWLHRHFGLNVACFDYRGYGLSGGRPDPEGLRNDALREFDWVRARAGRAPVIVYGYSLGSQLAIHVAAERSAAGAIVEAAPASAAEMEAWMLRWPFFDAIRWLTAPLVSLRPDPRVSEFLSAAAEVRKLRIPLAVIHGTRDLVVPIEQGKLVYDSATTPDKRFVAVQNAGHLELDYSRAPVSDAIGWVVREAELRTQTADARERARFANGALYAPGGAGRA